MTNFGAIDSDSLVYAAGFASQRTKHLVCTKDGAIVEEYETKGEAMAQIKEDEGSLEYDNYVVATALPQAADILDSLMTGIVEAGRFTRFRTYLTGGNQWRVPYSTIQKYKGNRDNMIKPVHYKSLRQHLVEQWQAYVIEYIEADDAVIMDCYSNPGTVCVSIDKDLEQFPGWHLNPKHLELGVYEVTEYEAYHNFYSQLLTGDSVDNIKGLSRKRPRRGIGAATAKKLLDGTSTPREMFDVVLHQYHERYPGVIEYTDWQGNEHSRNAMEMLDENAQLLYLARFDGDKWAVPND